MKTSMQTQPMFWTRLQERFKSRERSEKHGRKSAGSYEMSPRYVQATQTQRDSPTNSILKPFGSRKRTERSPGARRISTWNFCSFEVTDFLSKPATRKLRRWISGFAPDATGSSTRRVFATWKETWSDFFVAGGPKYFE